MPHNNNSNTKKTSVSRGWRHIFQSKIGRMGILVGWLMILSIQFFSIHDQSLIQRKLLSIDSRDSVQETTQLIDELYANSQWYLLKELGMHLDPQLLRKLENKELVESVVLPEQVAYAEMLAIDQVLKTQPSAVELLWRRKTILEYLARTDEAQQVVNLVRLLDPNNQVLLGEEF